MHLLFVMFTFMHILYFRCLTYPKYTIKLNLSNLVMYPLQDFAIKLYIYLQHGTLTAV